MFLFVFVFVFFVALLFTSFSSTVDALPVFFNVEPGKALAVADLNFPTAVVTLQGTVGPGTGTVSIKNCKAQSLNITLNFGHNLKLELDNVEIIGGTLSIFDTSSSCGSANLPLQTSSASISVTNCKINATAVTSFLSNDLPTDLAIIAGLRIDSSRTYSTGASCAVAGHVTGRTLVELSVSLTGNQISIPAIPQTVIENVITSGVTRGHALGISIFHEIGPTAAARLGASTVVISQNTVSISVPITQESPSLKAAGISIGRGLPAAFFEYDEMISSMLTTNAELVGPSNNWWRPEIFASSASSRIVQLHGNTINVQNMQGDSATHFIGGSAIGINVGAFALVQREQLKQSNITFSVEANTISCRAIRRAQGVRIAAVDLKSEEQQQQPTPSSSVIGLIFSVRSNPNIQVESVALAVGAIPSSWSGPTATTYREFSCVAFGIINVSAASTTINGDSPSPVSLATESTIADNTLSVLLYYRPDPVSGTRGEDQALVVMTKRLDAPLQFYSMLMQRNIISIITNRAKLKSSDRLVGSFLFYDQASLNPGDEGRLAAVRFIDHDQDGKSILSDGRAISFLWLLRFQRCVSVGIVTMDRITETNRERLISVDMTVFVSFVAFSGRVAGLVTVSNAQLATLRTELRVVATKDNKYLTGTPRIDEYMVHFAAGILLEKVDYGDNWAIDPADEQRVEPINVWRSRVDGIGIVMRELVRKADAVPFSNAADKEYLIESCGANRILVERCSVHLFGRGLVTLFLLDVDGEDASTFPFQLQEVAIVDSDLSVTLSLDPATTKPPGVPNGVSQFLTLSFRGSFSPFFDMYIASADTRRTIDTIIVVRNSKLVSHDDGGSESAAFMTGGINFRGYDFSNSHFSSTMFTLLGESTFRPGGGIRTRPMPLGAECSTWNGEQIRPRTAATLGTPDASSVGQFLAKIVGAPTPIVPSDFILGDCVQRSQTPRIPTPSRSLSLPKTATGPPTRTATKSATVHEIALPVELPKGAAQFSAALTGAATAAALFLGPSLALDAGRTNIVLSMMSRCQQQRKMEAEIGGNQVMLDKRNGEYAATYLSRVVSFPESFLPLRIGDDVGASFRGAVLGAVIFSVLVAVAATGHGAVLLHLEISGARKQRKLQREEREARWFAMPAEKRAGRKPPPLTEEEEEEEQQNQDVDQDTTTTTSATVIKIPVFDWMSVVRRARYPYFLAFAVAVQLPAVATFAFALVSAPGSLISVVDRAVFGVVLPLILFWGLPSVVFCYFVTKKHLFVVDDDGESGQQEEEQQNDPLDRLELEKAFFVFPKKNGCSRLVERFFTPGGWPQKMLIGNFVWSQLDPDTRKPVAGGTKASALWNYGTVITKFFGPLSFELLLEEEKKQQQHAGKSATEIDLDHALLGGAITQERREEILKKKKSLRSRIGPFSMFENAFFLVMCAAIAGITTMNLSAYCLSGMVALAVACLFALISSCLVPPFIAPVKNGGVILSDVTVFAAALAGIAAGAIGREAPDATAAELNTQPSFSAATVLLSVSSSAILFQALLTAAPKILAFFGYIQVVTKPQLQQMKRKKERDEKQEEMMMSMDARRMKRILLQQQKEAMEVPSSSSSPRRGHHHHHHHNSRGRVSDREWLESQAMLSPAMARSVRREIEPNGGDDEKGRRQSSSRRHPHSRPPHGNSSSSRRRWHDDEDDADDRVEHQRHMRFEMGNYEASAAAATSFTPPPPPPPVLKNNQSQEATRLMAILSPRSRAHTMPDAAARRRDPAWALL